MEGELPADLDGVYLRNTENPVHPAIGRYHPFDGDGMIHLIGFRDGRAFYRNKFVRTDALLAEQQQGGPLWAGLAERPDKAKRPGWGPAHAQDASSTDVVVHNGFALSSHFECGDAYRMDPLTLDPRGKAAWTPQRGTSAHTKVDEHTDELMFFNYSIDEPFLNYGVVDSTDSLVHYEPIDLPGPRIPHDMAFTQNYAILNDCPMFWEPALMSKGVYAPVFHREIPLRLGVLPAVAPMPRSAGSMPIRPTSCIGSTPTRTAMRSSSTGSSRTTRSPRSPRTPRTTSGFPGSFRWTGCRRTCTAGGSTSRPGWSGGTAQRLDHGVRDDQRIARGRPPVRVRGDCGPGQVLVQRTGETRRGDRREEHFALPEGSTAVRRRWRPGWAVPARMMAIW